MPYKHSLYLTKEQQQLYISIQALQNFMSNATLTSSEMVQQLEMTKKQKEKLVSEIYFKDKKRKEFYTCKDGRVKSYDPQFIASSKEQLIDKLYAYYFSNTLEDIYKEWVQYRAETKIVSGKTLEEDIGLWNRLLADSAIAKMQIMEDVYKRQLCRCFINSNISIIKLPPILFLYSPLLSGNSFEIFMASCKVKISCSKASISGWK